MTFSLNQKLAVLAFTISLFAMIISLVFPSAGNQEKELEPQYISVLDLARDIKSRKSISLIDVRSKPEYEEFHIPSAINISLEDLIQDELPTNNAIILYSGDDTFSEQAFFMLKERNYQESTFVLKGGVYDWYNFILYPKLLNSSTASQADLNRELKTINAFFGGRVEFTDDEKALDYYQQSDLDIAKNLKPKRKESLVRMGC